MSRSATSLLRRFGETRVVVVGDAIFDVYLEGTATRLCREGPAPVVAIDERHEAAGGAANVAVNCAALGAHVELCSVVGGDDDAARMLAIARAHGVGTGGVVHATGRTTVVKRRIIADGQLVARCDEGTEEDLSPADASALCAVVQRACARADVVVVSDNGLGVLVDAVIDAIAAAGAPPVIADGRQPQRLRRLRPAICAPSYEDVTPLLRGGGDRFRRPPDRAGVVVAARRQLLAATGADVVVVTLDRDGAVVLPRDAPPRRVAGHALQERCAAGAGDTFTAALALAATAGATPFLSASIAAAAAAVAVGKPSTATCGLAELDLRLRSATTAVDGDAALERQGAGGLPLVAP